MEFKGAEYLEYQVFLRVNDIYTNEDIQAVHSLVQDLASGVRSVKHNSAA